ncbi:three-Cys-motif partner protein TcmP [Microcoleus sp. FACHB-831]|jgi:three-Cys-motif partner protein|uniref:three-Cys-motif partner protein TcmP n=1 Tax=Microcoleus sp. FACHB-831 TaxID=2692827 RepID=UPI001688BA78|nr:three-Cys-motif partner protein TcmP [Microcoleus sp. FACHB-831]MBD1920556.1 three-Cys-motif partner protein TcmP [Microcoleus sp. FACHB-831]
MTGSSFFDESREQSLVKAEIVAKYFWAWAKVIIPQAKKKSQKNIAYIDLFSGPGRYKDGSKSTPLLILERAIRDADMREMLLTLFNDVDSNNTQSLQQAIDSLPNIGSLRNRPVVENKAVGEELVEEFEKIRLVPTLFFIDPWGYKGLSLRLIGSLIMSWGCDCIFFFNYNRINMGLHNTAVEEHMNSLFGKERADTLREQLQPMQPYERELTIVESICQALKEIGGTYPLPFRFKNADGNRTSHHLIFVSKNVLGYSIMKDIMAKESSITEQNVPSFEYNPATIYQPLLFELSRPLDALADMLLDEYAGQTMARVEVYNRHHVGKRYIEKNYREVLLKLESQGKIMADPPANQRRKNTLAKTVKITFPLKQ